MLDGESAPAGSAGVDWDVADRATVNVDQLVVRAGRVLRRFDERLHRLRILLADLGDGLIPASMVRWSLVLVSLLGLRSSVCFPSSDVH